ncbi:MAG: gliding motility protein GldC [Ignavibacteriales bacterium CG12_big_fil_rev_8_21_14_0_65_30_8]|nr:MAG: gliding motility protein GldC [Ignavibacteriales bacterium CG12_big_fil_rev_8_21_14_0_65_30_8]
MELKKSEIKFTVELDEKNLPKKIKWNASDANFDGEKECNSMLISVWDKTDKVTMGIDLWTNEMMIQDMNVHFYQTFQKMADTYLRSTSNNDISKMIKNFAENFGKKCNEEKK